MSDCLFCAITAGNIPSDKVYEDADCVAFRDIHPQAPTHILIVPKTHMRNIDECVSAHGDLNARLFAAAVNIARAQGLTNGYRLITNSGADARQSVNHYHIHLLGGATLKDNMG